MKKLANDLNYPRENELNIKEFGKRKLALWLLFSILQWLHQCLHSTTDLFSENCTWKKNQLCIKNLANMLFEVLARQ